MNTVPTFCTIPPNADKSGSWCYHRSCSPRRLALAGSKVELSGYLVNFCTAIAKNSMQIERPGGGRTKPQDLISGRFEPDSPFYRAQNLTEAAPARCPQATGGRAIRAWVTLRYCHIRGKLAWRCRPQRGALGRFDAAGESVVGRLVKCNPRVISHGTVAERGVR